MSRPLFSRLALKLLLFNVLVVFLPAAGLYSLRTLEKQLLEMQERAMVQQARLAAAALSGEPVDAMRAGAFLGRLGGHSDARIRIVDSAGRIVADSVSREAAAAQLRYQARGEKSRETLLYRIGATLWRPADALITLLRSDNRASRAAVSRDPVPASVIASALAGGYGATVRESSGQRSMTMYSALPVRGAANEVTGAVVVAQSTWRILRLLWIFRVDLFKVVLWSLLVAAALSLLVSATIARPLIRLRNEADTLLDRRGRLRGTFRGSNRRDEIGDLTRALETLTARLERHLAFVEGFSADVSHEFKNPLASIRSAAELLSSSSDDAVQRELCGTIEREVARLSRLLGGVREVSRIDADIDREPLERVDLSRLVPELARSARPDVVVDCGKPAESLIVAASSDRLVQAVTNVVDNAVSFSPEGGTVRVKVLSAAGKAIVRVEDEGPGIPQEHIGRIFDRFFSFRPRDAARSHDGLGLAITRAIVESYGGTVVVENRAEGGARFDLVFPRAA